MAGAGGGPGARGRLVLLVLCSWAGLGAAAPNPVGNLSVVAQNTSSITLRWEDPGNSGIQNITYWVQCTGNGKNKTQSTEDTSITVGGLDPGFSYEFFVWVEKDGNSSTKENLTAATAPNPVGNLSAVAQNTSSITLRWENPGNSDTQNITYWVQCTGNGKSETQRTADTNITVGGLDPGSLYEFSVWVEKNEVNSSQETLSAATAPNPVGNLSVVAQNTSSITLRWEDPGNSDTQDITYWVQCTENGKNETQSTADTNITMGGLEAGSLYEFSVWVEKNKVNSSEETLRAATAPNPVGNLSAEAQNTSSITLRWEDPRNSDTQNITYWVQCTGNGKNKTQSTEDTSITVGGLDPGSLYAFSVWVEKNEVNSAQETLSAATAPNPVGNLSAEAQNTSSITLRWEDPGNSDTQNITYWVQCTGNGKNETQHTADTNITMGGLEAGSSYAFLVWVEKNEVNSSQETLRAATAPNPVGNLSVVAQNTSSITLRWEDPRNSDIQDITYWVQCTGNGKSETQHTADTNITVGGLEAGSSYAFLVWVEKNEVNSSQETLSAATAPNPVGNLRAEAQDTSSITLRWEDPGNSDTQDITYWVQCTENGKNEIQSTADTSITVGGLDPGSLYAFLVWVEKNKVNSSKETLSAATAPREVTQLKSDNQTTDSVTLTWEAPEKSETQPYIYRVQWAIEERRQREEAPEGGQANWTGMTNDTWFTVEGLQPGTLYNFSVWAEKHSVPSSVQNLSAPTVPDSVSITSCVSISSGYGVLLTWSCPSGGYEAFEMEVGGQWSSQDRSSCEKGVTVLGLGPARSYPATVITVSNEKKSQSASATCHTEKAGVIAGALMGILLFLILVALLIFFLKKRNKNQEKAAAKDLAFSFPGDIPAANFADFVRKNEKDSNYGFAEEYQQLALEGFGQPQTVALAPENMAKNRYRNVLPYDWSRVPLQPVHKEPGSDYINASFMPGLWSSQEFIAAQGPLPQTVGDFWRLVWEQQSRTVVMLTNCVESGRVKCEHYWPLDTHPCTHGDLHVTLVDEEVTEYWAVRDLQLLHMEEQTTLSVRQFHYVAWPDHGVPHSPDPLLAFWRTLREWLDQTVEGGPPIVHCSAGVGRTGTLIALDVLLRQLECEGVVGPFSFVRRMRGSRPLMVQTEAQYVFLHQCILRFLQQSAAAKQEAIYEEVPDLIYENVAAVQVHGQEV